MHKVLLVHGIFSTGSSSVDKLIPLLEERNCDPVDFNYWPNDLLAARFLNRRRARRVRDLAEKQNIEVAVGHSNGCTILHSAARRGAPFKLLIYVNPALDSKPTPLPAWVERVYVLHAPDDMATWIAKFLLFHPWGDMGRNGYKSLEQRWINLNVGTGMVWSRARQLLGQRNTPVWDFVPTDDAHGHGGVWSEKYWTDIIADLLARRLVVG